MTQQDKEPYLVTKRFSFIVTLIGFGVPALTFGSIFSLSLLKGPQPSVSWLCAAASSVAAALLTTVMTICSRSSYKSIDKHADEITASFIDARANNDRRVLNKIMPTPQKYNSLGSLVEFATTAGDKKNNQDFAACGDFSGCVVLTIADGVTGSTRGELASKAAVEGFTDSLKAAWDTDQIVGRKQVREAYIDACRNIASIVETVKKEESLQFLDPQTTFIAIVELPKYFVITYVGDGAITIFRAAVDTGTSLLVPHSAGGCISRFLSAKDTLPDHAYIEFDKSLDGGELIIAGSDGGLPQGTVLKTAQKVLNDLKTQSMSIEGLDTDNVKSLLTDKVEHEIKTDDNRTLGVVLTAAALATWKQDRGRQIVPASQQVIPENSQTGGGLLGPKAPSDPSKANADAVPSSSVSSRPFDASAKPLKIDCELLNRSQKTCQQNYLQTFALVRGTKLSTITALVAGNRVRFLRCSESTIAPALTT